MNLHLTEAMLILPGFYSFPLRGISDGSLWFQEFLMSLATFDSRRQLKYHIGTRLAHFSRMKTCLESTCWNAFEMWVIHMTNKPEPFSPCFGIFNDNRMK